MGWRDREMTIKNMKVREYTKNDLPEIIRIWNEVVEEGVAISAMQVMLYRQMPVASISENNWFLTA